MTVKVCSFVSTLILFCSITALACSRRLSFLGRGLGSDAVQESRVETKKKTAVSSGLSPMQTAEMRGTYLIQLGELLNLDILTEQEYEE